MREIESYSCIVQLAKAGFGHGLVPEGIAEALGVPRTKLVKPPDEIVRPISLIGRNSTFSRSLVDLFRQELLKSV